MSYCGFASFYEAVNIHKVVFVASMEHDLRCWDEVCQPTIKRRESLPGLTVSSLFDSSEINDVIRSMLVKHTKTNIRIGPRTGEIWSNKLVRMLVAWTLRQRGYLLGDILSKL